MFESFWDAKTARILCTTLIFAMILAFLYGARQTLTLFLFAILFAYLVDPLVSYLEKPLRGRTQAIGAVYLLLIALLVGIGFVIGPKIAEEGKSLATSLPSLIDRIGSGQLVFQIGQTHGWSQQRVAQIQSFVVTHRNDILNYAKSIGEGLAEPAQHIWWLILIPILSLFFLKDGHDIAENLIGLARTPEETTVVRGIVRDVNVMLGSYIRAQLLLCAFTAVAYTVVLSFMQVPYAFILGPVAGVFEFVPTVGPAIAAIGIFAIAALTSYPHLAWIVALPRRLAPRAGLRQQPPRHGQVPRNHSPRPALRRPRRRRNRWRRRRPHLRPRRRRPPHPLAPHVQIPARRRRPRTLPRQPLPPPHHAPLAAPPVSLPLEYQQRASPALPELPGEQ